MKLAITPRFFESKVEQLIGIEKKYLLFFVSFLKHKLDSFYRNKARTVS